MIPKLFMVLVLLVLGAMAFSHLDFTRGKLASIAPAAGPVQVDTAQADAAPVPGGAFAVVDTDGKVVTEKDLVGDKYHLVFFGFANCAEACPAMLGAMDWVMNNLPPATQAKVQFVFVSVDSLRDTAPKLAEFVHGFNPTFKAWRGTPEQIERMTRAYMATAVLPEGATVSDTAWQASHSTLLYLMGPDGRYVTHLRNSDSATDIRDKLADLVK